MVRAYGELFIPQYEEPHHLIYIHIYIYIYIYIYIILGDGESGVGLRRALHPGARRAAAAAAGAGRAGHPDHAVVVRLGAGMIVMNS
jgi:hypothetical protein